jgi:hypothetical protein
MNDYEAGIWSIYDLVRRYPTVSHLEQRVSTATVSIRSSDSTPPQLVCEREVPRHTVAYARTQRTRVGCSTCSLP